MPSIQHSVIFAGEVHASLLAAQLDGPYVIATSARDFMAAALVNDVAFVDFDLLPHLEGKKLDIPIIGIMDHAPAQALSGTVHALDTYPWLAHLVSSTMLWSPRARAHLAMLLDTFGTGAAKGSMMGTGVGRTALLARASRRDARFERMQAFFARHDVSSRVIATITDVAEELVMNALYDAPVEAGYFDGPRQRIEDVDLPPERACEISYGLEDDIAFVRLRDPFGALTRERLLGVLSRCNMRDVELDESRGGAGLGLWRVFAAASTIAITVVPGSRTEFVVGISTKDNRRVPKPAAVHLFFTEDPAAVPELLSDDDVGLVDQSITLVLVA